MLGWAVTFLIIALIAAVLGFGGIAAASAGIAKVLFFLFLVMCVIFFLLGRSSVINGCDAFELQQDNRMLGRA